MTPTLTPLQVKQKTNKFLHDFKNPKHYQEDKRWSNLDTFNLSHVGAALDNSYVNEYDIYLYVAKEHSVELAVDCFEKLIERHKTPIHTEIPTNWLDRTIWTCAAIVLLICLSFPIYELYENNKNSIQAEVNRLNREKSNYENTYHSHGDQFDDVGEPYDEDENQVDIFLINGDDVYLITPNDSPYIRVSDTIKSKPLDIK